MNPRITVTGALATLASAFVATGATVVQQRERASVAPDLTSLFAPSPRIPERPQVLRAAEPQAAVLDDAVPLPRSRAVAAPGEHEVVPAGGDPHYLGFAGGDYYPPAGEVLDPLLTARLTSFPADQRPANDTYAFVMFDRRITDERQAVLESLGARVLGFHPNYTLKVALPPTAVDQVAALDFVRWIGVARPWQAVHPALAQALQSAHPGQWLDVYVDVFEPDLGASSQRLSIVAATTVGPAGAVAGDGEMVLEHLWSTNGWMQAALERAGIEILYFDDRIDAFRARMLPLALEALSGLDFVQFIELVPPTEYLHDESMTMINADDARSIYTGGTNSRAVAAHVDSGYELSHNGLNHIHGVGWDLAGSGVGPWVDGCGHGSHTAGTILGDGAGDTSLCGVAPGLGWGVTGRVFVIKLSTTCALPPVDVPTVLDILDASYTDPSGNVTPRPHVSNNSWGTSPPVGGWIGSEADAREYDWNAFTDAQLSVFASGNDGPGSTTVGLPAVAKNVLTVGSVVDFNDAAVGLPGSLWTSSSRGPCGDGRWKPNLVAPGRWIMSADAFNPNGFTEKSGTSMAAPHVTGAVASLIDAHANFAYYPELILSHLMATAVRKGDALLTYPSDTHLDEYGAGRVDATRAIWDGSGTEYTDWTFGLGNTWTYGDFSVPSGATRLIVVMTYVEPAASAGAARALVNDWDLYIDAAPIDPAGNTGDYVVQQSGLDNSEIRVIPSPAAGAWRWKVWPYSVTGSAYFAVTVQVVTEDTTPPVTVFTTANDYYVQPSDPVQISTNVSTQGGTASAVFLDSSSSGDTLSAVATFLKDGATTNLLGNWHSGRDLELGNVDPFFSRTARWTTSWATEGLKTFNVTARADNIANTTDGVSIYVDGTLPGLVTNLTSSTHTPSVWTNDDTITYTWTAATDNLSGIDGYGIFTWSSTSSPSASKDIEEVTSYAETLTDGSWYFNIRSVDNSGNWDDAFASTGPYLVDTVAPTHAGVITSSTHTVGVQSCSTNVTVNWTAASDALSGLAGYLGVWNTTAVYNPSGATNIAAGSTSLTQNIGSSASARYFHLRAKDVAGNYAATKHFGPVYANASSVSAYCTAKTNSLGCVPAIGWMNQPDKSAGNFTVTCTNVLNNKNGLLFWGLNSTAIPFQGGWKCVAAPTVRGPNIGSGGTPPPANNCTGSYAHVWTTAYMNSNGIGPGATVYCQWWMRDPASPSTTGLSNALKFTVCE